MPDNINTVEFMDVLTEGGFPEKQAKALASAMFQLIQSHLVTKDYLDLRLSQLAGELKGDMAKLEIATAQLKSELVQWMVGILIVQTGATAVMLKLLH